MIMLKHVKPHYERSDPQVMCGFGTTREQADGMLLLQPKGTFLLRFGSQVGGLPPAAGRWPGMACCCCCWGAPARQSPHAACCQALPACLPASLQV
jgi:hypothetical protein